MVDFFPLHVHSDCSLLDGLSQPRHIARRCVEANLAGSALTDHGSISGAVGFIDAMTSRGLKPIIGCELYLSDKDPREKDSRKMSHLVVLAKNIKGWLSLVQIVSRANHPDFFYYKPRIDLEHLAEIVDGNIIAFSGHMGSDMANCLFNEPKMAYAATNKQEAGRLLRTDWKTTAINTAERYRNIFGKENFFLEIQLVDRDNLPATLVIADCLREVSDITGIPCVATPDAHYAGPEDAADQRVLLCTGMDTTLAEVNQKIVRAEDVGLGTFFKSRQYHIPDVETMLKYNTEEEIDNSMVIANMCEEYKLASKPRLPKYPCPNNMTSGEYLRQLCKDGWRNKIHLINRVMKKLGISKEEYGARFEKEYAVLTGANLSDYFLIVNDIIRYAISKGQITGSGRGSGAGSLILYLLDVTCVDPLEFDLLFERFYNAGRNTADHVSMPDVDMDFEHDGRELVLQYVRNKFGHDRVAQILTYNRMQGRSALKDVLRVHGACSPAQANKITAPIPSEAEISDELQEMRKADKEAGGDGEASIIQWALENHPKQFSDHCYIDDKGKFQGPLAKQFEQAIRLEGTKRSQSRHPAGVIISNEPLHQVCPLVYDKSSGEYLAGMEMDDLETCGHIKFDFLGVSALDKVRAAQEMLSGKTD